MDVSVGSASLWMGGLVEVSSLVVLVFVRCKVVVPAPRCCQLMQRYFMISPGATGG